MVHPATAPKDGRQHFEFIAVGGGTAGCTVAGRLAENPQWLGQQYGASPSPDTAYPSTEYE